MLDTVVFMPSKTLLNVVLTVFNTEDTTLLIPSKATVMAVLTALKAIEPYFITSSQFLYNATPIAINAVIAAITIPTGPVIAKNTVFIKAKLLIMRLIIGANAENAPNKTTKQHDKIYFSVGLQLVYTLHTAHVFKSCLWAEQDRL